jgi:hypothetical protein
LDRIREVAPEMLQDWQPVSVIVSRGRQWANKSGVKLGLMT